MYIQNLSQREFEENGQKKVELSGNCVFTGEPYSVVVGQGQLLLYISGALAQNAFPDLTDEDREFLISGISPQGWQQTFGS